jgi:acyl-CoA synthetase (AMP-forming)/AMP-acid ligase II
VLESLGDILRGNAYRLPDETAIVHGGRRITFGEQFVRSQRLASALYRAGLRRQDRVAVLSKNSERYLEIYGAAELSGFVVATVNFRLTAAEIGYIVGDCAPKALFFEAEHADGIASLRASLPSVEQFVCIGAPADGAFEYDAFRASGAADGAPLRSRMDDVMHLIYTSGTTGRPKGVVRTHRAEMRIADLMTTEVGVLREDVVLIMMPLFHVGARWVQLGTHLRGARIILHREFDPLEVLQTIERERVTVVHMTPTIIQRVLDHPRIDDFDLRSLRTIYYSAAPMPLPLLRRGLAKLGSVFLQAYGMTEGYGTTLHKGQHRPDGTPEDVKRLASVGQAATGVDLRIVSDDGELQPPGVPGEIELHTDSRMSGYWNNSIATAAALQDGWYKSGDIGYLDDHGYLYLVDRKKDMIVSGGENIYCREVEEAIGSHDDVAEVAVIGVPDPAWGEAVRAIVVVKDGAQVSEAQLVEHCRTRIASYKKPRSVVFVSELPRLTTGKVNKVLLRERYGMGSDGRTSSSPS